MSPSKRFPVIAVLLAGLLLGAAAKSQTNTDAGSQAEADRHLPQALVSVLPEAKEKSQIPILLPSKLPQPFREAKYATLENAAPGAYAISLYFELGSGDAGFAAFFEAEAQPSFDPRELGTRKVKLAHGVRGFFRPVSCGGSCAPANLWWEQNGVLYQIQLKLRSTLDEREQERIMETVANSAILFGPR